MIGRELMLIHLGALLLVFVFLVALAVVWWSQQREINRLKEVVSSLCGMVGDDMFGINGDGDEFELDEFEELETVDSRLERLEGLTYQLSINGMILREMTLREAALHQDMQCLPGLQVDLVGDIRISGAEFYG